MLSWIKRMFTAVDRQEQAFDRAATAAEQIADDLETVRDRLRERFGLTEPKLPAIETRPQQAKKRV